MLSPCCSVCQRHTGFADGTCQHASSIDSLVRVSRRAEGSAVAPSSNCSHLHWAPSGGPMACSGPHEHGVATGRTPGPSHGWAPVTGMSGDTPGLREPCHSPQHHHSSQATWPHLVGEGDVLPLPLHIPCGGANAEWVAGPQPQPGATCARCCSDDVLDHCQPQAQSSRVSPRATTTASLP